MRPLPSTAQPLLLEVDSALERFRAGLQFGAPPHELARFLREASTSAKEAAEAILREHEGIAVYVAEDFVDVPGTCIAETSNAFRWRLSSGRELWIPKSQVLEELNCALRLTRWFAKREQLIPNPEVPT